MFSRLGRFSFTHPWLVLGSWLAILAIIVVTVGAVGPNFGGGSEIPNSESGDGFATLDTYFGGFGSGQSGSIVFRADQPVTDPAVQEPITALLNKVAQIDGVIVKSPYLPENPGQISFAGPDAGKIAFASLSIDESIDQAEVMKIGVTINEMATEVDGLQVEVGGAALGTFEPPASEAIGLAFAVFVLIVAMGSVLAMGLTIGVALVGVGCGLGLTALISNFTTVPEFGTTLGAMIGIGVGIDYALFIVTRYRESTRQGFGAEDAVAIAIDTAGRAVIFAGMTVVISLLGLVLIGLSFVAGLGYSSAVTVAMTMLVSVTLLPAVIGLTHGRIETTRRRGVVAAALAAVALLGLGLRINALLVALPLAAVVLVAGLFFVPLRKELKPRREVPVRDTFWYRWSRIVQARPWVALAGGLAVLLFMAIPVLDLRLGFSDEGNYSEETTTRRAYDLVAEGFGPGFNGPLLITAELTQPGDLGVVEDLAAVLATADGIASVSPIILDNPESPGAALLQVTPTSSPQDEATNDLVATLRETLVPSVTDGTGVDANVTGSVAVQIDFSDYLASRMLVFFGVVLSLSFLLLMTVFRSLLVPLKAVLMNVISIAASYGVVVAVFQWGWGASLFGTSGGPIEPFIPMMMFAIVFGLSMDYEVFLLSRIKEEYDHTGDPVNSVADGLAATARVITAAAAIMVVVFGSFMFEDNRIIQLFGLGLAVAVLLDATLVRMLLVPATMALLGRLNWWLPAWLDRLLPNLNVEGTRPEPPSHAGGSGHRSGPDSDPSIRPEEPVLVG